jgi:hypothetical protein
LPRSLIGVEASTDIGKILYIDISVSGGEKPEHAILELIYVNGLVPGFS